MNSLTPEVRQGGAPRQGSLQGAFEQLGGCPPTGLAAAQQGVGRAF